MVLALEMIKNFFGFNKAYPMQIKEKGSDRVIPCKILDDNEGQGWEIPTEPIENSEFIGDTQFRQPRTISLNVFVLDNEKSEFERQIREIQKNKNGFEFTDRDGFIISDLWLTDYNKTNTANNGLTYALNFQEVILVEAFDNEISYQKTSNAGLGGTSNQGEQSANVKKDNENQNSRKSSTFYGWIYQ